MTELIKCECGSDKTKITHIDFSHWVVTCFDCGKRIGFYDTKSEAIEAWNRRGEE